MSKIGLIVLLSFLSGRALSQNYFVFIGSDDRQPFYVRIDSQLYSSSPEGHLLLAPLKDSDYTITIGFPGDIFPQRRYSVNIRGKDREFGLRRQDDGGWRLYDVLGKNWVTALEKETRGEPVSAGIKKDDAFSRMMAGVVHDTAVLYNTYAMEQALVDSPVVQQVSAPDSPVERRGDTVAVRRVDSMLLRRGDSAVVRRDSVAPRRVDSAGAAHVVAPGQGPAQVAVRGAGVVKVSEKKSSRSVRQVYTDDRDTVVVIIPRDTGAMVASGRGQAVDTVKKRVAGVPVTGSANTRGNGSVDTPAVRLADTASRQAKTMPYINSDCHAYATDYDVDRLRVKLLDAAKDEDKLAAARKVFKTKCFYTPQVRALSEVFTTDAGKFRFFEAAWPFAADEHFSDLSALLSDPVYISKFRTMTGARP